MVEIVTAWKDGERITRCPRCNKPLTRAPQGFHWRGEFFDAAHCEPCNSIWSIVGEEMPPLRPVTTK